MAVRNITTRIALDGEQEFKQQMTSVNSELKTLKTEMKLVDSEFKGQANTLEALTEKDRILRKEIEQQQEKVKALEKAVLDAAEAYGEADKKTDDYKRQLNLAKVSLNDMNRELKDTDKYLDEAKQSSDGCAKSIDEFGKKADSSGGLLNKFGGNLKALGIAGAAGVAVAGVKAVVDGIFEVVESTEEYRKIMGTLEVSSQAAGYSAEQTKETYTQLYAVLGDTQTAATATANLQALGLGQKTLTQLTDAAIGAWASYGDSIPIDGLAEAINETVKVGQVTGTFADVLNWAGVSEDAFNEKLAACATASERANLVLGQLNSQGLAEAGQRWTEVNEDIVANNLATAKADEAMARLGERLAPLAAALKTYGAEALMGVIDAGEDLYVWFTEKIPASLDRAREQFEQLPANLQAIKEEFGQLGRDIIEGFVNGIKERWNRAVESVTDFVDDVKGVFTGKGGFDTHSPSKWSEEMFGNVIEGMVVGNRKSAPRAIAAAQATTEGMLDALTIPSNQMVAAQLSLGSAAGTQAARAGIAAAEERVQSFVINLVEQLDGATLARKTYKYNIREGQLRGDSLVEVHG